VFSFADLCGKCDEVISKFVERICLDEKNPDESGKTAPVAEKGREQPGGGAKSDALPF
jgi:hypothetical protein